MFNLDFKRDLVKFRKDISELKEALCFESSKNIILEIEKQMLDSDFWSREDSNDISIERSKHKRIIKKIEKAEHLLDELSILIEILEIDPENKDSVSELESIKKSIRNIIDELEVVQLLSGEYDALGCFLTINAGAGGTESCDWVDMLARMYSRWGSSKGIDFKLIDFLPGDVAGNRYISYKIDHEYMYGYLKAENGIHRLVRNSPFDTKNKRHTSFASVSITPIIDSEGEYKIDPSELEISTARSSGAGGQHVNTTDSKVRVKHIPTGISVSCQKERSQAHNKKMALDMLTSKLCFLKEQEEKAKLEANLGDKLDISWGSQCRNYVLSPYKMIKDTRTGRETTNVSGMLDGELLDAFIKDMMLLICKNRNVKR